MRPRPGDRKRRWKQSCDAEAGIFIVFGIGFLVLSGFSRGGFIMLLFNFFMVYLCLRDAKRGWKIRYDLPPKYYRDIESSNPITKQMAKECAEETLKEAKDPNRKKYAFEKRR